MDQKSLSSPRETDGELPEPTTTAGGARAAGETGDQEVEPTAARVADAEVLSADADSEEQKIRMIVDESPVGAYRMRGDQVVDDEEEDLENQGDVAIGGEAPLPATLVEAEPVEADGIGAEKLRIHAGTLHSELEVENVIMDDELHPDTATPALVHVAPLEIDHPELVQASPFDVENAVTIKTILKNRPIQGMLVLLVLLVVGLTAGTIVGVGASRSRGSNSSNGERDTLDDIIHVRTTKEAFVNLLPEYTRRSLMDSESRQSQALNWLWEDPEFISVLPHFRLFQRFVLATIIAANDELGSSDDFSSSLLSAIHECAWLPDVATSISCSNDKYEVLDTSYDTIPPEIALLTDLVVLKYTSKSIQGSLPTTIGLLTALSHLELSDCNLTSALPTEIGRLDKLVEFHAAENNLMSALPSELGLLTNLTTLDLRYNNLEGSIPSEFGQLTSSTAIALSDNLRLDGSIPSEMGKLTNVLELFLERTSISGTVPLALGNLTNMVQLTLFETEISGAIPAELGKLTSLTKLALNGTRISGTIPSTIAAMTSLSSLLLHRTNLTGTIPTELRNLSELSLISLSNTSLTGTFPLCESESLVDSFVSCQMVECECGCTCQAPDLHDDIGLTRETFAQNVLPDYSRLSLADLNSAQSLALDWLWTDPDATRKLPLFRRIQRYALACLFFAATTFRTEDEIKQSGWLTSKHECDWAKQGIVSSFECRSDRLYSLEIHDENQETANGVIAPEVGLLTDLVHFRLSFAKLRGQIPSTIGLATALEQMSLRLVELTGIMPTEIGNLKSLAVLQATTTLLSSTIPTELGVLTELHYLALRDNQLSGTLPTQLGELTRLRALEVSGNGAIHGVIPTALALLTDMNVLSVANTALSGTIPDALVTMTSLHSLRAGNTSLDGPFPLCSLTTNGSLVLYVVPCERVDCACNCACG